MLQSKHLLVLLTFGAATFAFYDKTFVGVSAFGISALLYALELWLDRKSRIELAVLEDHTKHIDDEIRKMNERITHLQSNFALKSGLAR
jgi:hypothetical protein